MSSIGVFARHVNSHNRKTASCAEQAYNIIDRMPPDELEKLRGRITAKMSLTKRDKPERLGVSGADWLLEGITHELRSRGIMTRSQHIMVDIIYPKYWRLAGPAMEVLREKLGGDPTAAELAALGRLAAECLAEQMTRERMMLRPKTMLQRAGDAAAAVEVEFPGYAASNILRMVLVGKPMRGRE